MPPFIRRELRRRAPGAVLTSGRLMRQVEHLEQNLSERERTWLSQLVERTSAYSTSRLKADRLQAATRGHLVGSC